MATLLLAPPRRGGMRAPPNLETSRSCCMSSISCSTLRRMAQQGKQHRRMMMVARCRITPTRSRFLLPYVCKVRGQQRNQLGLQERGPCRAA